MTLNKDLPGKLHQILEDLASIGKEGLQPGGDAKGKASAVKSATDKLKTDKHTKDNINFVLEKLLNLLAAYSTENNKNIAEQTLRINNLEKKHAERLNSLEKNSQKQEKKYAEQVNSLEQKSHNQSDLLDEIRQRGLKGNLIISSPNAGRGIKSLIKSPEQLDSDVTTHALDLIHQKYNVSIPAEDIQACHHLPSHSNGKTYYSAILIRIWNRRANSAWADLKKKILSGEENKSINLYVNFQLTKRRNTLAFHLRRLKKEGKIVKFYTDENGHLAYKKSDNSVKRKVTYVHSGIDSQPATMTPEELMNSVK